MSDNGQVVVVGFFLILATAAALVFSGLLEVPTLKVPAFDLEANQVEVIGFDTREDLFSSVSVELPMEMQEILSQTLPAEEVQEEASLEVQAQTQYQAEIRETYKGHGAACGR